MVSTQRISRPSHGEIVPTPYNENVFSNFFQDQSEKATDLQISRLTTVMENVYLRMTVKYPL